MGPRQIQEKGGVKKVKCGFEDCGRKGRSEKKPRGTAKAKKGRETVKGVYPKKVQEPGKKKHSAFE